MNNSNSDAEKREAKIIQQLIRQACAQAGGKPVLEVTIAAAKCAQLDEGLARFYWDQYAADTVCQGARLHYRTAAFIQKCPHCGHVFASPHQNTPCPKCHAAHTATLIGDECAVVEDMVLAA